LLQDIRYGIRVLLKDKSWTLVVVLSLAIGIGANTALFSALNAMVFRKLEIADAGSLVRFRYGGSTEMSTNRTEYGQVGKEGELDVRSTFSYATYQAMRDANRTLSHIFAGAPLNSVNVVVEGQAEIAAAFVASGNYHQALGARTVLGRTINADDGRTGAPPLAVISYQYWRRRFVHDPQVIGKIITVE